MRRKKFFRACLATVAAIIIAASTVLSAGCAGADADTVRFWVLGDPEQVDVYTRMKDEFNETYGKEHNIYVSLTPKAVGQYDDLVKVSASSRSGPDVFLVEEAAFKSWIIGGYMAPIDEYLDAVTDIDLGDIIPSTVNRLKYNVENNTSNEDDPTYALPLDSFPTALYYNESLLEKAGILVISVDEEDMDAWNRNEIADKRGMKKSDYEAIYPKLSGVTVPKKGYFRSKNVYTPDRGWKMPDADEVLVFNNRIAMNWDEIEDIAMLFSPEYNKSASATYGTDFGYFTEWWFNYGWSVGGDCLADLTGNGAWNFSLLDSTPNFIVADGKSYTGHYSGKTYQGGETLSFIDRMDAEKGQTLEPDNQGDYYLNGKKVGVHANVLLAEESGTLLRFPSTREAFNRYLKLGAKTDADIDGEFGYNISPNPDTFVTRTSMNYFFSGKLVFLANTSAYMTALSEEAATRGFEWDIAPLAVYKEYTDPNDPYCDEVKVQGVQAGHSNSRSMAVRAGSDKKDKAAAFIKWMASPEGQKIKAELGSFPNQESLMSDLKFDTNTSARNAIVFSESLKFQKPGDWWYMPDHIWVEEWCVKLNSYVRNGLMTYAQWYPEAIENTNRKLKDY